MPGELTQLAVQIDAGDDTSRDWVERITRELRAELEATTDAKVELAADENVPEGARGFLGIEVGALIVEIGQHAVPVLAEKLFNWIRAPRGRVVKLKFQGAGGEIIEMEGSVTLEEVNDLLNKIKA